MEYKDKKLEFQFLCCDLWEWAMDLVKDPLLAPHFHWDAQCLYKYKGKSLFNSFMNHGLRRDFGMFR